MFLSAVASFLALWLHLSSLLHHLYIQELNYHNKQTLYIYMYAYTCSYDVKYRDIILLPRVSECCRILFGPLAASVFVASPSVQELRSYHNKQTLYTYTCMLVDIISSIVAIYIYIYMYVP